MNNKELEEAFKAFYQTIGERILEGDHIVLLLYCMLANGVSLPSRIIEDMGDWLGTRLEEGPVLIHRKEEK